MSDIDDIFDNPPETVTLEVTIPSDFYAELAGNVASDDDPPRAIMDVEELISLIVQEAWEDADKNTPWLQRVQEKIKIQ